MTGFKSGASADDPFSDDSGDDDEPDTDSSASETASTEPASRDESEPAETADREQSRETDSETTTESESTTDDEPSADSESTESRGLPWIYERNSITDGRKKTVQLHLQKSSLDRERDARLDVEEVLGESVKKADLREAALVVGLERIDEVADQLREWGYDFE